MKKTAPRPKAAPTPPLESRTGPSRRQAPGGDGGPGAAGEPLDVGRQADTFEAAARLFNAGQFQAARELFHQAARGPSREMAHSALLKARMCQRRLERSATAPRSPEEHYNLAVALINERRLQAAEEHLRLALAQAPESDHLYYVMALCRALGGDVAGASTLMRRAIELQPRNRFAARNDPDFAEVSQRSPLFELLYPERTRSG